MKLVCENEIVIMYVDDVKALSSRITHSIDGAHIGVFADGCSAEFSNISMKIPSPPTRSSEGCYITSGEQPPICPFPHIGSML